MRGVVPNFLGKSCADQLWSRSELVLYTDTGPGRRAKIATDNNVFAAPELRPIESV